jgi:FMN phosphatase YigB (HAD superfamily)
LGKLRIINHVDFLGTTTGLAGGRIWKMRPKVVYQRVLEKLEVEGSDVTYISYSKDGDIEPVRGYGMSVILYSDEVSRYTFEKAAPMITSFAEFEAIITS